MVEVTVLIPIYNANKNLQECLNSVLRQTLQSIEFICINDGSTDNSLEIIEEVAYTDSRVRVINKENTGYGDSLNRGLDHAKGNYVGIVESDDFINSSMYQTLFSIAKEHDAEIVKSDFFEYTNGRSRKVGIIPAADAGRIIVPCNSFEIFRSQPCIWSSIYSLTFLKDRNIIFNDSPGASFQDTSFNLKTLATADRVWLTEEAFVHYRRDNEGSSINSSDKIYAVCDEYDVFERYMVSYPDRMAKIEKPLQSVRFESYSWNLSRLSGSAQEDFYKYMYQKFSELRKEGLISYDDFSVEDAALLDQLLNGDKNFIKASIEARTKKYAHNDI